MNDIENAAQVGGAVEGKNNAVPQYYLVVAKYNHQSHESLKGQSSPVEPATEVEEYPSTTAQTKKQHNELAKEEARKLFGYVKPQKYKPNVDWSESVSFLGSFPYYPVPESNGLAKKEKDKNDYLYGWVAIVSTSSIDGAEEELAAKLANTIGMPNSLFCQVFDIHVSKIGPDIRPQLFGVKPTILDLEKAKDPAAWEERAQQVYDDQTPKMWAR